MSVITVKEYPLIGGPKAGTSLRCNDNVVEYTTAPIGNPPYTYTYERLGNTFKYKYKTAVAEKGAEDANKTETN